MSRRTAGVGLTGVASVLYATRYLAAAMSSAGQRMNWNAELFRADLQYLGNGLTIWATVALGAGIFYLVWAEIGDLRKGAK